MEVMIMGLGWWRSCHGCQWHCMICGTGGSLRLQAKRQQDSPLSMDVVRWNTHFTKGTSSGTNVQKWCAAGWLYRGYAIRLMRCMSRDNHWHIFLNKQREKILIEVATLNCVLPIFDTYSSDNICKSNTASKGLTDDIWCVLTSKIPINLTA